MTYKEWANDELKKVRVKIEWVAENNKYKIPYTTDENGVYDNKADKEKNFRIDDGVNWWTNGFWAGIMWLLYNDTKAKKYVNDARIQEETLDRAFDMFYGLHHDVGFMFVPSAVADYRLTGDMTSRKRGLHAANLLAGRFNEAGGFIRAWNDLEWCDTRGWAIIDCMFNLSLLFWAGEEIKDPRYTHIAVTHANTVADAFVRNDGSVCHIVEFDPETGRRIKSHGGQGYAHGSAWTRGQGWALYGFVNAYLHSGEKKFLDTAVKVGDYCISKIGPSYVIPVDFDQPEEPDYEDSCAACIIAGGFLELAGVVSDHEKKIKYEETAFKILETLAKTRIDYSKECEALVKNCSAAYHSDVHHTTMVYADYFYIEALYKMAGSDFRMW
ncbi:MAG: glycoside hydrolase family 88 protein [Lachnospiraceae bacterium]|nr:glycoside hydrolase family 88 protein [Lachnospiraceae bacterium]